MSATIKTTLLLLAFLMSSGAFAEEQKPSREREALRRSQQQLQQTQQELTGLKDKLLTAEHDSQAGQKELQSAKARAHSESLKTSQLQAALDEAQKQLQLSRAEKTEQDTRLAHATAELSRTQREQAQAADQLRRLQSELAGRTRDINSCDGRNAALYQSGRELIAQCQIQAVEGAHAARAPALGMQRVALENLLESYRDKLDEQKPSNASKTP